MNENTLFLILWYVPETSQHDGYWQLRDQAHTREEADAKVATLQAGLMEPRQWRVYEIAAEVYYAIYNSGRYDGEFK